MAANLLPGCWLHLQLLSLPPVTRSGATTGEICGCTSGHRWRWHSPSSSCAPSRCSESKPGLWHAHQQKTSQKSSALSKNRKGNFQGWSLWHCLWFVWLCKRNCPCVILHYSGPAISFELSTELLLSSKNLHLLQHVIFKIRNLRIHSKNLHPRNFLIIYGQKLKNQHDQKCGQRSWGNV